MKQAKNIYTFNLEYKNGDISESHIMPEHFNCVVHTEFFCLFRKLWRLRVSAFKSYILDQGFMDAAIYGCIKSINIYSETVLIDVIEWDW